MIDKLYTQDLSNCFNATIDNSSFADFGEKAIGISSEIKNYSLIQSALNRTKIADLNLIAQKITDNFSQIIVVGTGGSTICPQTLTALGKYSNIKYLENTDPFEMELLLNYLDIKNTFFIITSKSGETLETIAQFLAIVYLYKEKNIANFNKNFLIITDPKKSSLKTIAEEINISIIDHESEIGGRYSIFTNVGLLPALISGLDGNEILDGAEYTIKNLISPAEGAALNLCMLQNKINNLVSMSYISCFKNLNFLFKQLYAESLGKNSLGINPLTAIGTIDQHSQLQLYLDGPKDKFLNIISLNTKTAGNKIAQNNHSSITNNYNIGDIHYACKQATCLALKEFNRPFKQTIVKNIDAKTISALAMHLILETIITAKLMNIDPFNQPSVEIGKIKTRELLANGL